MKVPGAGEPETLAAEAESSALAEAVDRMAHQLKNPLQAMTVNLEVIRLRAARAEDREELERLADVVDENIRLLDRRIRMLISLARRSPEEKPAALDLGEQVRQALDAFRLDEREDGLGLQVRLPGDDGEGPDLAVRAREGGLLALVLAGAACAAGAGGGEPPYLAVGASRGRAWIEFGPRADCPGGDGREELVEQARRAGGEVGTAEEEPAGRPLRVRFPRP